MEPINVSDLLGSFNTWDTWNVLIIVAIFGMIGGLAHKLVSTSEDRTGLPGHLVVGAVSAIAVLFIFSPQDAVKLIALSLVAGYGGKAIMDALGLKVKLAISQEETKKAKEDGKKTVEEAKRATDKAKKLIKVNDELVKSAIGGTLKTRLDVLESIKTKVPELALESSEDLDKDIQEIEVIIEQLSKSFE